MLKISLFIVLGIVFSCSARSSKLQNCTDDEWRCHNGVCINEDFKCNGKVDCADGSDESFGTCWDNDCYSYQFKCVYGGCVSADSVCNGVKDCRDNSDELLGKCRNELTTLECLGKQYDEVNRNYARISEYDIEDYLRALPTIQSSPLECVKLDTTCKNGQVPKRMTKCNGKVECKDGSDETMETCAALRDSCGQNIFRCAYGACVHPDARCNGIKDCADNSDESEEICNVNKRQSMCSLPEFPKNGFYTTNQPSSHPNRAYDSVYLNYTCYPGFKLIGPRSLFCSKGVWSEEQPKCISQCLLPKQPSVEYICLGDSEKECDEMVPDGMRVRPKCRAPNYYASTVLTYMQCDDGIWNYVATCSPQCGLISSEGEQNVIGGQSAKRGELPWHTGIYRKTTNPYMQICGGSLVSTTIIISAAHCFWSDVNKQLPAENFAVAVGKLYRPWNNSRDADAQKSDVQEIKIPPRFRGAEANFQEDIAIVRVATAIEFRTYVRPVCVDFDYNFERRQLSVGHSGKVAGWGLTEEDGRASPVLKVTTMPFVAIERCLDESPQSFREFITVDKFCAGNANGTTVCKGDSGGGLVFLESERGSLRYYLRGIVSTSPRNEHLCNSNAYAAFTWVSKHEQFIREYL